MADFGLAGRWTLLTGVCGHLGGAMAEAVLEAGGGAILLSRSATLPALADDFARRYGSASVRAAVVDLYDPEALSRVLAGFSSLGPITGLVNNAFEVGPATGFDGLRHAFEDLPETTLGRAMEAGVGWAFRLARALLPGMREAGGGSIVNVASMYGKVAPDPSLYEGTEAYSPVTYGCAKAALLALTRYLASYYGAQGIRCNAISPGPFPKSPSPEGEPPWKGEFLERLAGRTALGRIGRPEELGGAVVFLLSSASSFITGHELVVDGGWTVR